MVCCDESSNPDYSKILSIPSASDTFTIFLLSIFTPFLSFSLLDWFQINLNYNFILSTALSCQIDVRRHTNRLCLPSFFLFWVNICGHTRRSCLPLFSVSWFIFVGTRGDCAYLSFLVGSIFSPWLSCTIVTCWHAWLAFLPFFGALGRMISPTIFL